MIAPGVDARGVLAPIGLTAASIGTFSGKRPWLLAIEPRDKPTWPCNTCEAGVLGVPAPEGGVVKCGLLDLAGVLVAGVWLCIRTGTADMVCEGWAQEPDGNTSDEVSWLGGVTGSPPVESRDD